MPADSTVRLWVLDNVQGFAEQYARARLVGYHTMADELIEIADNPETGAAAVKRDRLKVDTRKWLLSKALPKIYGDKVDLNASLDIAPATDDPSDLRELARRTLFGLMLAVRAQNAEDGEEEQRERPGAVH